MKMVNLPAGLQTFSQLMSTDLSEIIAGIRASQVGLGREGTDIVLPKGMELGEAISILALRKQEEDTIIDVSETINCFPYDGANAVDLVLHEMCAFSARGESIKQTMFGDEVAPNQTISIEVELGKAKQVPWGSFRLPGIDGEFNLKYTVNDKRTRVVLLLVGKVKTKYKQAFLDFCAKVREKLKTDSIYKGNAIKIRFRDEDGEVAFMTSATMPKFMDLGGPEPIFNQDTTEQLEKSILTTIRYTHRLRRNKLSIKRTVLLEGDFGTGKTLMALETARECVKHGWTFLYCLSCSELAMALDLADQYAPAVVFCEDVDREFGKDRNGDLDAFSYILDGVDNKARETLLILTTNKVHEIQQLMLRPGRIDSVISITPPNEETVWKLVERYSRGALQGDKAEFKEAIRPMVGQNAAFIAEVISKAKLSAVARSEEIVLTPEDVKIAVDVMYNHVRLMEAGKRDRGQRTVRLRDLNVSVPAGSNGE
jgi:transitional endoplasmic reticulum ATPase